jgi:hypothetical protein
LIEHPAAGSFMRIADIGKGWQFYRKATRAGVPPRCGGRQNFGAKAAARDPNRLRPLWSAQRKIANAALFLWVVDLVNGAGSYASGSKRTPESTFTSRQLVHRG